MICIVLIVKLLVKLKTKNKYLINQKSNKLIVQEQTDKQFNIVLIKDCTMCCF